MLQPARILVPILILALVHGLFFAVMIPPWDLYDESTHLSYALVLRDERRIPHLEETTRIDVVESEIATDRWERFDIGEPDTSSLDAMGLGGRLYQGYQPPLYYLSIIPATYIGSDVLGTMYAARVPGAIFLVVLTASTWVLARLWFPGSGVVVPAVAAATIALTSAAASAAGRVNNDLLAAVMIVGGLVATTLLVQRPSFIKAIAVGTLTALAILTKSHGVLLLGVSALSVMLLWWMDRFAWRYAFPAILPGFLVAGAWTVWTFTRYGHWTGTEAFLEFARPFEPLSTSEFIHAVTFHTWSSYWSTYDGGALEIIVGIGWLIVAAVGIAAVVRNGELRSVPAVCAGAMFAGTLALLWYGNASGLVYPQGRILLPILPVLAVLSAAGWHSLGFRWSGFVPLAIAFLFSVAFTAIWFVPFFY